MSSEINPLCKFPADWFDIFSLIYSIAWVEFGYMPLVSHTGGQWVHDRQAAGWSAWAFSIQQSVRRAPMYPVLSTSNLNAMLLTTFVYFILSLLSIIKISYFVSISPFEHIWIL